MITKTTLTIDDMVESLTGHEENDIEGRFGFDPTTLLETKATMGLRALVYVLAKRDLTEQDVKDPGGKAYKHAMDFTLKQVGDFFPDEVEEPVPSEPVTPAGKGDSQPD